MCHKAEIKITSATESTMFQMMLYIHMQSLEPGITVLTAACTSLVYVTSAFHKVNVCNYTYITCCYICLMTTFFTTVCQIVILTICDTM